jgi:hypothetical protein
MEPSPGTAWITRRSGVAVSGYARAFGVPVERREHQAGVRPRVDAAHRSDHDAVGADQERRALDAHLAPAAGDDLAPDAVRLCDPMVRVGEKRERK